MAISTLPHFKLTTILSISITFALLVHIHVASDDMEVEDGEEYIMDDHFLSLNIRSGSRFLADKIKKGERCDALANNICSGVSVNNGTGLLQCCKKHCRNVLGDRNNCGVCGQKCGFGQLCCNGKCTDIAYNADHCGKCNKKCRRGMKPEKCEYGVCGYA